MRRESWRKCRLTSIHVVEMADSGRLKVGDAARSQFQRPECIAIEFDVDSPLVAFEREFEPAHRADCGTVNQPRRQRIGAGLRQYCDLVRPREARRRRIVVHRPAIDVAEELEDDWAEDPAFV